MKNKISFYPKRRHLQQWYKDHMGCDPLALGIPFIEKKSHWPCGFYRLWREEDVLPFKNEDKINPDAMPDCHYGYHNGKKIPKEISREWQKQHNFLSS